ncbi:RHS repeat-associated core domain-containing protein, partial [Streptomyces sp. NPDC002845]
KTRDTTTGLTHIGAREYDPTLGQFISVDPILETDKPQTLNGYSYAAQNPLTNSDPTGLVLDCGNALGAAAACPTRPDGTEGNGRPNEGASNDSGTANAGSGKETGGSVEYAAPAEAGCGFWDVKCGWNQFWRSDCGFWDVKCGLRENYEAWKNVVAPDMEEVEACGGGEVASCGWLLAGFLPAGKLKRLGKLLGEGKNAQRAAELIGEAVNLVGQISYGEGHLSKAVQLQRLIDKKKNGNYASALLDDGTTIVAHSDSVLHSEEHLLNRAGARKIVAVYSEREPCGSGHNCSSQLRSAGVKNVSWSFPWNDIGGEGRARANRDLSAAIRSLFNGG